VLNLCPARASFEEALGGNSDDADTFLEQFSPILELIQTFLVRMWTSLVSHSSPCRSP
jgi:hypothetical protein